MALLAGHGSSVTFYARGSRVMGELPDERREPPRGWTRHHPRAQRASIYPTPLKPKSGRHFRKGDSLDHVIVLGERHPHRVVREFLAYYHGSRTHLALDRNAPEPREVEPPERGVVAEPVLGGLHHRYRRAA